MFTGAGEVRNAYAKLHRRLCGAEEGELYRKQQAADLFFLHQGITFTVYSEAENVERIFPYDLLPRIITGAEWEVIERGLIQRITALNLFLHDVYHA
ncbi:MAG: circularly permuted type 2 ATP-grasp protein, partial [Caldilineaceae bacterium]|nr:circularly permuted type 2 ATP-grasp protein [Caldilineaceae bacterium]